MLIATITTDPDGRLTDDSTCTINGQTVPVPLRVPHAGRVAPARIVAAIQELGYTTIAADGSSLYYGTLRRFDGCVTVAVDAA